MNDIIRQFYLDNGAPVALLRSKMQMLSRNQDIAKEFEYWIKRGRYLSEDAVCIEGCTAKKLSESSPYLDGEGAFMMLIQLRENPERARSELERGFKMK